MILLFSDWVLSKSQGGLLGYQYDNLTRELVVQGDLPEGWTWDILVSANGNSDTWPLALGDGQASITLTDDNLSVRGEYYLQLRGTNGDQVRHTNVITAYNSRSLSGAGQWPTLPTEWIQAEKDIKELNSHPPVPGSNGYWLLWDLSSHSYQESDLPVPVGPAGPPNVLEIGTVETLPADQQATASITGESPAQKLNLGIPQGKQGATGNPGATPTITVGTVTTLDPGQDATAEITGETPNLTLNLGIPEGQPGQDGVQLNDNAVSTTEAWSSKKIVDTLCPPFTETGNPITCNPVEDYPLDVTVTMEPIQSGTGDPSPDNVRPISGRDEVTVNVRGKNLWNFTLSQAADSWIIPFIPQGSYVISLQNIDDWWTENPNKSTWFLRDEENTSTLAQVTFSSPEVGERCFATFNVPYSGSFQLNTYLTNITDYVENLQLELGSTPTAYEPYQPGTTATLTLPETIYGGTVDAVTGEGSSDWTSVTFDGTENWQLYGFSEANNRIMTDVSIPVIEGYTDATMSNALMLNRTGHNVDGYITYYLQKPNDTTTRVIIWADGHSLDELKQVMVAAASQGTPLQIVYKVANPTSFQAIGNQALPAVAGLNTVYTDGDSLAVSGRQDLLYTLQTMQTQTTNLNRFIAEGGTQ